MRFGAVRAVGLLQCVVATAALGAIACGGHSPAGPSPTQASAGPVGRAITVMTYNIHAGTDAGGRYSLDGAIAVIARLQPDLAGLQEVTRNHPQYNCDDQPAIIADGLRGATGRTWDMVYVQEWFTPDTTCLQSGRGTAAESEGLAFFAPEPIGAAASTTLYNSRIGISVTTPTIGVPVIVTHLASGGGRSVDDRTRQIAQLLPWSAAQGPSRILMGDFNAAPGSAELQPVFADLREAFIDALAMGTAGGVLTGDTRVNGGRLDYVFYTPNVRLSLESAEIVDTTALLGARREISDHRPVVARFRVQ